MLARGLINMSMIPYSNFVDADAGAPVKIITSGGVQGCIIVAKEGIVRGRPEGRTAAHLEPEHA